MAQIQTWLSSDGLNHFAGRLLPFWKQPLYISMVDIFFDILIWWLWCISVILRLWVTFLQLSRSYGGKCMPLIWLFMLAWVERLRFTPIYLALTLCLFHGSFSCVGLEGWDHLWYHDLMALILSLDDYQMLGKKYRNLVILIWVHIYYWYDWDRSDNPKINGGLISTLAQKISEAKGFDMIWSPSSIFLCLSSNGSD